MMLKKLFAGIPETYSHIGFSSYSRIDIIRAYKPPSEARYSGTLCRVFIVPFILDIRHNTFKLFTRRLEIRYCSASCLCGVLSLPAYICTLKAGLCLTEEVYPVSCIIRRNIAFVVRTYQCAVILIHYGIRAGNIKFFCRAVSCLDSVAVPV